MDMTSMCPGAALCDLFPAGWHWLMPLVLMVLLLLIFGLPIAHVLHKAGRSRWWTVLAFLPLLNLIALWVFAFTRWPSLERTATASGATG